MFIGKFVLLLLQVPFVLCCDDIDSRHQYGIKSDVDENLFDCRYTRGPKELATCLLQKNTLLPVLKCAEFDPHQPLSWEVTRNSLMDALDLIPSDADRSVIAENDDDGDGYLRITPRGLLIQAASTPACHHCKLLTPFYDCPKENLQEFLDCLCCEEVTPKEIKCLEDCIWSTPFGSFGNINNFKPLKWNCGENALCEEPDAAMFRRNGDQTTSQSLVNRTEVDAGTCPSGVYRVKDGTRVPCTGQSYSTTITKIHATGTWSKVHQYTEATNPVASARTVSTNPLYSDPVARAGITGSRTGDGDINKAPRKTQVLLIFMSLTLALF